jgi:hypothetical protein
VIQQHRNKASKAPEDNFVVAACDGCEAHCPESKLPGRRGDKAREEAHRAALVAGWKERHIERKRGRRLVTYVELLCPKCQRSEWN